MKSSTKNAGQVLTASALGAGVGALVGLELARSSQALGLVVGAVTGGLVGYFSYKWPSVVKAIWETYNSLKGWQPPPRVWWSLWSSILLGLLSMLLNMAIIICPLSFALDFFGPKPSFSTVFVREGYWIPGLLLWAVVSFFPVKRMHQLCYSTEPTSQPSTDADMARWYWAELYQTALPMILFWHMPRGLWWAITHVPITIGRTLLRFGTFMARLGWGVFLRIHSDCRLICGVDAFIGAVAGFTAGSAIVGALLGGVLGLVNYAIITERWLRPKGYLGAVQ